MYGTSIHLRMLQAPYQHLTDTCCKTHLPVRCLYVANNLTVNLNE